MNATQKSSEQLRSWRLAYPDAPRWIDELPSTPRAKVARSPPRTTKSSKRKRPTTESSKVVLATKPDFLSSLPKKSKPAARKSIFNVHVDAPEVDPDHSLPRALISPSKPSRHDSMLERSVRMKENTRQTSTPQSRRSAYTRRSTWDYSCSLRRSLLQDQTRHPNILNRHLIPKSDSKTLESLNDDPRSSGHRSLQPFPPPQPSCASHNLGVLDTTPLRPPASLQPQPSAIPTWFSSQHSPKASGNRSRTDLRSAAFMSDLTFEERLLVPHQGRFSPQAFSTPSAGRRTRSASLSTHRKSSVRDLIMDSDHETPATKSQKTPRTADTLPTDSIFSSRTPSSDLPLLGGRDTGSKSSSANTRASLAAQPIPVSASKSLSDMSLASLAAPTFMIASASIDESQTQSSDLLPHTASKPSFDAVSKRSVPTHRSDEAEITQRRDDHGSEHQDSLFSTTISNRQFPHFQYD